MRNDTVEPMESYGKVLRDTANVYVALQDLPETLLEYGVHCIPVAIFREENGFRVEGIAEGLADPKRSFSSVRDWKDRGGVVMCVYSSYADGDAARRRFRARIYHTVVEMHKRADKARRYHHQQVAAR
jgi:hypothetical protein